MYLQCKTNKIPVELMNNYIKEDNNSNSNKITSPNHVKKTRLRHSIILKYLYKNNYLLFIDADIYFFKNPKILFSYFRPHYDMIMPCDNKKCDILYYGFIFIRKSKNTIKYFKELIKIEKECKDYGWKYVE